MAFQFESLSLPADETLPAEPAQLHVTVTMHFREEESGEGAVVHLTVPVPYRPGQGRAAFHEAAMAKAEDLCGVAAHHLEENDVDALQRFSQGS